MVIVSISKKENDAYSYLRATESWLGTSVNLAGAPDEPSKNSLWKIGVVQNGNNVQYTFTHLVLQKGLVVKPDQPLQVGATPSAFTLEGTISKNTFVGLLCYNGNIYVENRNTTPDKEKATTFIIEKWELEGTGGGEVEGIFETESSLDFGFTPTDINNTIKLTFKLKQGRGEGGNYY